eukprot:GFUD01009893.1.p1 GENE.GFUD01009893.1~~GFUD01009893.1.p1  ORF type:complete len:803 (+),score=226.34 GFUD01009893.1:227-2635(+)
MCIGQNQSNKSPVGLFYSLPTEDPSTPPQHVSVPLTGVTIRVRLVNFIAQVEVTQEYQNKENNAIEVVYFFPVEEEAAVTGCSAELEGRNVVAKIKKKDEAQKLYNEAVNDGKTAVLLDEIKPDIFELKVGHLSPGAKCKVKITYIMELPVENGKTKLTIPTTIAPRYVPADDASEAATKIASIEHDLTSQAPVILQLDIEMKTKITSVTSPSHLIVNEIKEKETEESLYKAVTRFDGMTSDMDRDIIVLIESEEPNQPKVFYERGDNGSVVALVSLVPKFELKKQPSEIIFLIDRSGSMNGQSITLAKEALQLFVQSLPVDSYFNICSFGSTYTNLFPESQAFTDESLASAKQLLQGMHANLGGTEIYRPLEAIFKSQTLVERPRQVFVITDGEVSNSQQCIQLVKEHNQQNRVFTLGIGASADRHLVKGMARAGMGVPSFTTYGENIAGKVLKQLKQSLQPCMHGVQIDWGTQAGGEGLECQAPHHTPPVFDGSRLLVYKLWDKADSLGEKVTIKAEKPEGQLCIEVKVDMDSVLNGELIHQLFARKRIQDLEENSEEYDTEEVRSLVTDLGLKYSLASKQTSFIAVDDESKSEKLCGAMIQRHVRNQVPQGYGALQSRGLRMNLCLSRNRSKSRSRNRARSRSRTRNRSRSYDRSRNRNRSRSRTRKQSRSKDRSRTVRCRETERTTSKEMEECVRKPVIKQKTSMEKILALTSFQTAAGYFTEDKIVENIIGEKFSVFKNQSIKKKIGNQVWVTALIIAYIELNMPADKDTWDMIVQKARDWLENSDVVVAATECLMA